MTAIAMATATGSHFRFSVGARFAEEKISGSELIDADFIASGMGKVACCAVLAGALHMA
jgi:hypothetical protein